MKTLVNLNAKTPVRAGLAIALIAGLSLLSWDASARERAFSGTRTGPSGRSVQHDRHVQAGNGARTTESSVQGSNGHGFTRETERSYDPETQTVNRSGTVTTNSGKTYNREGSTQYDGNGTVTSSGSVTGPNGQSATRTGSTTVSEGSVTSTATVTGPNGKSATREGSVVIKP